MISPELLAFIRIAYGVLMLLTLAASLPHARRYFVSERWGGYAQSTPWIDAVQNPFVSRLILAAWCAAALCLVAGRFVVPAAGLSLGLCYYFFVRTRWKSALRGMGAPGFIAFWLGAAVFLLELTARHAPDLSRLVLLTLQIDFAAIMISAGLYKLFAGYRHQHGMELGMVNPEWGYWPSFWQSWSPASPLFRFLDEMAWFTEVAGGVLMLIPATRALGGLAILLSFVFIATQIRLGFLCEMVMVCCLLFVGAPATQTAAAPMVPLAPWAHAALKWGCWAYIGLLPVVRSGMFYNQLRHRSFPAPFQRALDFHANLFGLILWRVFTADVVNFFIRIWEETADGSRRLISDYRMTGPYRFSQVAECIAITSVFTTLKYYPSNRAMFEERLLRYARTIPHAPASRLIFEWVNVAMDRGHFEHVPVTEFSVDVAHGLVAESVLSDRTTVHGVPAFSPVHEGARPGSYAPLAR